MDADFWLKKWEKNEIGFHKSGANPLLVNNFRELDLAKDSRLFLPLCGKTLDIAWLLSKGYRVAGAELSKTAIDQLFIELGIEPKISRTDDTLHYSATNIDIFVGDIFELSSKVLGEINAVYDRAALVALPDKMRNQYTAHIMKITNKAPQLLISYEYDQNLVEGPPFSVSNDEVNQHYAGAYKLILLESLYVTGGLKGKCAATESVWLLQNS